LFRAPDLSQPSQMVKALIGRITRPGLTRKLANHRSKDFRQAEFFRPLNDDVDRKSLLPRDPFAHKFQHERQGCITVGPDERDSQLSKDGEAFDVLIARRKMSAGSLFELDERFGCRDLFEIFGGALYQVMIFVLQERKN